MVTAAALDQPVPNRIASPPYFYPQNFIETLKQSPNPLGLKAPYALCFHATARAAKCWDTKNWIALGQELASQGLTVVFPWGNPAEKKVSEKLAAQVPGALVPKAFNIQDAFALVAQAKMTIGVDTGLTHLSAVLGRPTIELYVDSPCWKTEGYWQADIANLGDIGRPPTLDEVFQSLKRF